MSLIYMTFVFIKNSVVAIQTLKNTKMILQELKIDSLRLLIPIDKLTINPEHSTFTRTLTTINEDAEVIGSKKEDSYRLHTNPCSSHYLYATTIIRGQAVQVVKLGFSSKTLKHKYFEGINKINIDDIYNFIISENVISFSKATLLNARVVDVDICTDILLEDSNVRDVVSQAKQLSVAHKETISNAFSQVNNVGIEWSNRNKVGKSYIKKQYLKYYAKALELKHNSTLFYNTYIKPNKDLDKYIVDMKLIRVETTLKNKAHWDTYNVHVETLNDLLTLDLSNHKEVFTRPINHYMTGSNPIEKTNTKLTPTQRLQLQHLKLLQIHSNINQEEAIYQLCFNVCPDDRKARFQYKKSLLKLVDENRVLEIEKKDKNQLDILTELEKFSLIPKKRIVG